MKRREQSKAVRARTHEVMSTVHRTHQLRAHILQENILTSLRIQVDLFLQQNLNQ